MFQKIIGILMLVVSVFLLSTKEVVRNPEFVWFLLVLGIVFILMPKNLFE